MTKLSLMISNELTDDLKWRENELAIMHKQLILSTPKSLQEQTLLRANLTMIYAHYEGFCKFALTVYINTLDNLRLKRKDLNWTIATFSLVDFHKNLLTEKNQTAFFTRFMKEINGHLEEVAEYQRPYKISNLWPDTLLNWLSFLSLDTSSISEERILLESLVKNRNEIAHGKRLTISTRSELEKYKNSAMLAMHQVAIGIVEALEQESYKRLSPITLFLDPSEGDIV